MRACFPLLALLAAGCIRSAEGPDLGACAVYPEGSFTFGEIGIGTCLAGPTDIRFFEQDGRTWLGVSNADPFINFSTGSFLLIDWASVDPDRLYNPMHELDAAAQVTPRLDGEFTHLPERDLVFVTNRLSPEAQTRSANDQAYLIDVSDPERPRPWAPQPVVHMQDDPYVVVRDPVEDIVYVGNLTAHSVTLLDTSGDEIQKIDVSPQTRVTPPDFIDVDSSGSLASIDDLAIADRQVADSDLWTLTFVDKLVRLWVPTLDEQGEQGLVRWTSGDVDFMPSGLGIEVDPGDDPTIQEITDPFVFQTSNGLLTMLFADRGVIHSLSTVGPAGDWTRGTIADFAGAAAWDELVSGPSVAGLSTTTTALYYDGRTAEDANASIGVALTEDGLAFAGLREPILTDPGLSLEQPFVRADAITNRFRMWMSVWDGVRWSIGLAESEDGLDWGEIVEVEGLDATHVAAPNVAYVNGRYLMWYTTSDGASWAHATAWSYDGLTWFEPTVVIPSGVPFDLDEPPRLADQVDTTNAWRMVGRDEGVEGALIEAGTLTGVTDQGLLLSLSSGQEVDNDVLPDGRSINGLQAGSAAVVDGQTVLYVTATGRDERRRIGAITPVGDSWAFLESDIVPSGTGGNVAGVSDPLVVALGDGTFVMFYAAEDADGISTIRRATSTDGRSFEPLPGAVLLNAEEFDDVRQAPHSLEVLPNGRVRLWFGAFDGTRWTIGAATADDPLGAFTLDPGPFDPWQLESGPLGSFDDSGVKDPMVFVEGGVTQMYYAGFDGLAWHIGHAVREDDVWIRRTGPGDDVSLPAMSGLPGSFSSLGVEDPVLATLPTGETVMWHTGTDGLTFHIGEALPRGEVVFPAQRFPTPGDVLTFEIVLGGPGHADIHLEQNVEAFSTSGIGMSSMALDEERGFLYVTSKLANFVYVIDIRDDTSAGLEDANYRDVEALISVETDLTPLGFRDVVVDPVRDRLYLSSLDPDGVVVIDLNDLVDNDRKEVIYQAAMFAMPLLDSANDRGAQTSARFGGDRMALTDDASLLLVPHFTANALFAFDLTLGAFGEAVAVTQNIGENPHQVRISPDGRFAVVANYLGDIDEDETVSSTLAVVDLDPDSETYLEIVTWIVNR